MEKTLQQLVPDLETIEAFQRAGAVLIACDNTGRPLTQQRSQPFQQLLLNAPPVLDALPAMPGRWQRPVRARVQTLPCGLCLIPLPCMRNHTLVGFHIAIVPTLDCLGQVPLMDIIGDRKIDFSAAREVLRQMKPPRHDVVPRIIDLLQILHQQTAARRDAALVVHDVSTQLADSYDGFGLLYNVSREMTVTTAPDTFVETICCELTRTLPYEKVFFYAAPLAMPNGLPNVRAIDEHGDMQLERPLSNTLRTILRDAKTPRPIIAHPSFPSGTLDGPSPETDLVICPVYAPGRDRIRGLLVANTRTREDEMPSAVDLKMLTASAAQIAIVLENGQLYDQLGTMFVGTLEALTAAIDAKDRYTRGHSQRVAMLTNMLARAAGIQHDEAERMRVAALVHDIGKIGVPESVLHEAGSLDSDQQHSIRQHPVIGYRILRDIPHLSDVLPGVLYHHERWDGQGYPDKLCTDEIPLVARVIAVADAFDAMSANRTYRQALDREHALAEISRHAGAQFDPQLANCFLNLSLDRYDELLADHQLRESTDQLDWTSDEQRPRRAA